MEGATRRRRRLRRYTSRPPISPATMSTPMTTTTTMTMIVLRLVPVALARSVGAAAAGVKVEEVVGVAVAVRKTSALAVDDNERTGGGSGTDVGESDAVVCPAVGMVSVRVTMSVWLVSICAIRL